jgi:hypothetical protein
MFSTYRTVNSGEILVPNNVPIENFKYVWETRRKERRRRKFLWRCGGSEDDRFSAFYLGAAFASVILVVVIIAAYFLVTRFCIDEVDGQLPEGSGEVPQSEGELPKGDEQLPGNRQFLEGKAELREGEEVLPEGNVQLPQSIVPFHEGKTHLQESDAGPDSRKQSDRSWSSSFVKLPSEYTSFKNNSEDDNGMSSYPGCPDLCPTSRDPVCGSDGVTVSQHTDKKINKILLIYQEIQTGAVARSYTHMRKGFQIYEEMRKYLVIFEEAVSHIYMYMTLQPLPKI